MNRLTLIDNVAIVALLGGLHSRSHMFFDALGIEYTDCRLRLLSCVNLCESTMDRDESTFFFVLTTRQTSASQMISTEEIPSRLFREVYGVNLRLCRSLSQRLRYTGSSLSAFAYLGTRLSHCTERHPAPRSNRIFICM
jgi:hypothetical protein